jgi:hypothetical protein
MKAMDPFDDGGGGEISFFFFSIRLSVFSSE